MMDRTKAAELPKLQCGFIDFVCMFVYKVICHVAFTRTKIVFIDIDSFNYLVCCFWRGGTVDSAASLTFFYAGVLSLSPTNPAHAGWHHKQQEGVER